MNDEPRSGWHVSPQVVFRVAIVFFGLMPTAQNPGNPANNPRYLPFLPEVSTAGGVVRGPPGCRPLRGTGPSCGRAGQRAAGQPPGDER